MDNIKNIIKQTGFEAELRRKGQAERQKKYLAQFEGSYVYYIIDKRTQVIVYVGECENIVSRYNSQMTGSKLLRKDSSFHNWCIENDQDKANYEMHVLDLTGIEELDYDDRLLIEKMLQYYHAETLVNKRVPSKLTPYEIERFEYITALIDFNFRPYTEVKVSKMNNKKVLSDQTKDL